MGANGQSQIRLHIELMHNVVLLHRTNNIRMNLKKKY